MRLIDADSLIDNIFDKPFDISDYDGAGYTSGTLHNAIDKMPTIDIEDLRPHGHWKSTPDCWYCCSVCGFDVEMYYIIEVGYNYCPHCGAKMNG